MRPFRVRDIDVGGRYAVWPFWLLTSLGITLALSINLVVYSASRAHEKLPTRLSLPLQTENPSGGDLNNSIRKNVISSVIRWLRSIPRRPVFSWLDYVWLAIWLLYIVGKYAPHKESGFSFLHHISQRRSYRYVTTAYLREKTRSKALGRCDTSYINRLLHPHSPTDHRRSIDTVTSMESDRCSMEISTPSEETGAPFPGKA